MKTKTKKLLVVAIVAIALVSTDRANACGGRLIRFFRPFRACRQYQYAPTYPAYNVQPTRETKRPVQNCPNGNCPLKGGYYVF